MSWQTGLNKQNSYSFQNVIAHPAPVKFGNLVRSTCCTHSTMQAKFRNAVTSQRYCYSCATAAVQIGESVQEIIKRNPLEMSFDKLLTPTHKKIQPNRQNEAYRQVQGDIKSDIEQYNRMFQDIRELLNDMQIRDIMRFNHQLESNDIKNREQSETKVSVAHKWQRKADCREALLRLSSIYELIQQSATNLKNAEGEKPLVSLVEERKPTRSISPKCSPANPLRNIIKTKNEGGRLSLHEQNPNKSIQNEKTIKQPILKEERDREEKTCGEQCNDTPQSLKDKMDGSSLKVTAGMATTMFQKIDVCESINLDEMTEPSGSQTPSSQRQSKSSNTSKYRYDRSKILDTDRAN